MNSFVWFDKQELAGEAAQNLQEYFRTVFKKVFILCFAGCIMNIMTCGVVGFLP